VQILVGVTRKDLCWTRVSSMGSESTVDTEIS